MVKCKNDFWFGEPGASLLLKNNFKKKQLTQAFLVVSFPEQLLI